MTCINHNPIFTPQVKRIIVVPNPVTRPTMVSNPVTNVVEPVIIRDVRDESDPGMAALLAITRTLPRLAPRPTVDDGRDLSDPTPTPLIGPSFNADPRGTVNR